MLLPLLYKVCSPPLTNPQFLEFAPTRCYSIFTETTDATTAGRLSGVKPPTCLICRTKAAVDSVEPQPCCGQLSRESVAA